MGTKKEKTSMLKNLHTHHPNMSDTGKVKPPGEKNVSVNKSTISGDYYKNNRNITDSTGIRQTPGSAPYKSKLNKKTGVWERDPSGISSMGEH